jgi:glycosyltransferase involved in cell wall biosynthesis
MTTQILHIIDNLDKLSGGTSLEVASLASRQATNSSYRVSILTRRTGNASFIPSLAPSVRIRYIPSLLKGLPLVSSFQVIFREALDSDVIFVTGVWGFYDGIITVLLICLLGLEDKIVIRTCGMLEPYILAHNWLKKRIALFFYVRRNISKSRHLVVNSRSERDNLVFLKPQSVSIIKNGLDLPVINPVSKSSCKENIAISLDHLAYTYIGRIHPKKGLHIFLAAVLAILDSPQKNLLKPFSLLIAGDFSSVSYQAQIFHIVKLIDARIPISFLGHVEGRMKTDLLLATDVFFLPSLSEGMPNAILEALSYGIPVFATTTCNLPEIAQYSMGILAEPSVESISTSLLRLQSLAPADLLNMSANARHFVSAELSPSRTDTSYDSLISAILSVPLPF